MYFKFCMAKIKFMKKERLILVLQFLKVLKKSFPQIYYLDYKFNLAMPIHKTIWTEVTHPAN